VFWELQLENITDQAMIEILESQKVEANSQFGKFIERIMKTGLNLNDKPVLSHNLFKGIENLRREKTTYFVCRD
jgi:hypothetical protein